MYPFNNPPPWPMDEYYCKNMPVAYSEHPRMLLLIGSVLELESRLGENFQFISQKKKRKKKRMRTAESVLAWVGAIRRESTREES